MENKNQRVGGVAELMEQGSGPVKICRRVSVLTPPPLKMSHSFTQNCCCITLQVPHNQERKVCVEMKGKTNFSRRLQAIRKGTGIVECLEIIDLRRNLKQFDDPEPRILLQIYATDKNKKLS